MVSRFPAGVLPRAAAVSIALSAVLVFAACAPAAPPAPEPHSSADQPTSEAPADESARPAARATAVIAGEHYAFELAVCMIQPDAVLASGGGADGSGGPVFLDVDLMLEGGTEYGEARIELGTDQQFDSRDDFLSTSVGSGDPHTLTIDGSRFTLEGEFRHSGEAPLGVGTVTADCG